MFKNAKIIIANGKRINSVYSTLGFKNSMELKISRYCCKVVSKEMIAPIRHAIAIAV